MSRQLQSSFLEEEVRLLVRYFGVEMVRTALSKVSNDTTVLLEHQAHRRFAEPGRQANPSVTSMLKHLRQQDKEKYRLLTDFYIQLKENKVLPESQDIRYFVQLIGLKEISGKSRKNMIPMLMRFLLEQPTEQLQIDIKAAANVSEEQRQQGFSVLTDKLIGGK
jgi:hypothetical protein